MLEARTSPRPRPLSPSRRAAEADDLRRAALRFRLRVIKACRLIRLRRVVAIDVVRGSGASPARGAVIGGSDRRLLGIRSAAGRQTTPQTPSPARWARAVVGNEARSAATRRA